MLKFIFFSLLLANAGLYAWHQGYLNEIVGSDHEPARLSNQLNIDKIKLVNASVVQATSSEAQPSASASSGVSSASLNAAVSNAASAPTATVAAASVEKKPDPIVCTEIGNFLLSDAKRFETQLSVLSLGDKQSRINVQEVASHMVYIPPLGSKEAADKKAGELKQFGVTNFFIIQDPNSSLRWGISLGIFKTEDAAQNHLANLNKKGVHSARVGARNITTNKVAFQLRNIDLDAKGKLEKIKAGFPAQEIRACTKKAASE